MNRISEAASIPPGEIEGADDGRRDSLGTRSGPVIPIFLSGKSGRKTQRQRRDFSSTYFSPH
jgi:hypothetical protein